MYFKINQRENNYNSDILFRMFPNSDVNYAHMNLDVDIEGMKIKKKNIYYRVKKQAMIIIIPLNMELECGVSI